MESSLERYSSCRGDDVVELEGNYYFPPDRVNEEYLKPSDKHTTCPWKGEASYYTVEINGEEMADAAWYYPEPKEAAKRIKQYVAFWKDVGIVPDQ